MSTKSTPEPILFTFPESVFSRRIHRYLDLRRLPYTPIRVPPNLPRPILSRLSINHRRIPILALGRDIYIDTRLIIPKLETLYPDSSTHPVLGARNVFGQGVESMLEGWAINAGPFWRASGCLPPEAPLLRDDAWMKDRADGSGGAFTAEGQKENRAWCLSQLRIFLGIVERMLGDGREWILGGEKIGLADLHAWPADWVIHIAEDMGVAMEEQEGAMEDVRRVLSEAEFPMVHAWSRRLRKYVEVAEKVNTGRKVCGEGEEAEADIVKKILEGDLAEKDELVVDETDVLGLRKGDRVSVAPTDFGFTHAEVGTIVGLTKDEVVIETNVQGAKDGKLRLHFPRLDFKIVPVDR